jgi:hypothetical protein
MNQPTQQLIDRAGLTLKPREMYDDLGDYWVSDRDHFDDNLEAVRAFFDQGAEKLVHLVVQECAQFTDPVTRKLMMKHFGVES